MKKSETSNVGCAGGLPCGFDGEESDCDAGKLGSIPGLGRSPGGELGSPLQCPCLENPRQRSLAGCSAWAHKEMDTTVIEHTAQE